MNRKFNFKLRLREITTSQSKFFKIVANLLQINKNPFLTVLSHNLVELAKYKITYPRSG